MSRIVCTELELSTGWALPEEPEDISAALRVLVRLHGQPLGYVQLASAADASGPALRHAIVSELGERLRQHLAEDGLDVNASSLDLHGVPRSGCAGYVEDDRRVTVVVCTRNRASLLADCLAGLQQLEHRSVEIIVVDNAPIDDSSARVFNDAVGQDGRFRYIREPRPGLSCARNRGLSKATGALIAYTDDDVKVDPGWISGLLLGFRRSPEVACVTGLVATAVIEGAAERFFDARVSWASSCRDQVYRLGDEARGPLYPWAAGQFGTGANFAFRTSALREIGGFDEALGAGSPTQGGEDLDVFVRVLRADFALAYEPSALVWHVHRSDPAELERQMFGYGLGLSAYLTKHLLQPHSAGTMLRQVPRALRHMNAVTRRPQQNQSDVELIRRMRRAELQGLLRGPVTYARARRRQSPENRKAVRA